jgi:hypothetical protein
MRRLLHVDAPFPAISRTFQHLRSPALEKLPETLIKRWMSQNWGFVSYEDA